MTGTSRLLLVVDIDERPPETKVLALLPDGATWKVLRWSERGGIPAYRAASGLATVDWHKSAIALEGLVEEALAHRRRDAECDVVVTAHAPVPLLVRLGMLLSGFLRPLTVVNLSRGHHPPVVARFDGVPSAGEPVFDAVSGLPDRPSDAEGVLVLYVSAMPASPRDDELRAAVTSAGMRVGAVVKLCSSQPRDLDAAVSARAAHELSELVERATNLFPNARDVAVFVRGPGQLAIAVGRAINPRALRSVLFAEFAGGRYQFPLRWHPEARPIAVAPEASPRISATKTILHLSDLHLRADDTVITRAQPLLADLRDAHHPAGEHFDHVVLSGDLTNRATPDKFKKAVEFVEYLSKQLHVPLDRFLAVPGNHDLSWGVPVYEWRWKRELAGIQSDQYLPIGEGERAGALLRNDERYPLRFENYSKHFHEPLFGRPYPLVPSEQYELQFSEDRALAFLGLNSAHAIDEARKENSDLNEHALTAALAALHAATKGAPPPLVIAVWHHPPRGEQRRDGLLGQLRSGGVKLCLHGHVHEDRAEVLSFMDKAKRQYVVGAGSLGAPANDRPPNTPRLYNLLQVDLTSRKVRVHAHGASKERGVFEPWPRWPTDTPGVSRSWYEIEL